MRSLGQSNMYASISTSLKRLTAGSWKRGQVTSSYILDDQKVTEAGSLFHPNMQGNPWVKPDGSSDLDTLVTLKDSRSAWNTRPSDSFA